MKNQPNSVNKLIVFYLMPLFIILILLFTTACSSGPKRQMLITTIQKNCRDSIETANSYILSGNYTQAEEFLDIARRQALSIDNYDLLLSVTLAHVSLYLSYNPPEIEKAQVYVKQAYALVNDTNKIKESELLCAMAEARILIAQNAVQENFKTITDKIDNAKKVFKDNPYNHAQCDSILGDIYRLSGKYKEADKIYNEAAKLFTDQMYLSEIGITWYKIAQNRSQSGNKKGALEALNTAIYYDRCAENSMALGADYYIKAVILLKEPSSDKSQLEARKALLHSAEIYNAANMPELANKSLELLATLE